jgi:hypothetical protein
MGLDFNIWIDSDRVMNGVSTRIYKKMIDLYGSQQEIEEMGSVLTDSQNSRPFRCSDTELAVAR